METITLHFQECDPRVTYRTISTVRRVDTAAPVPYSQGQTYLGAGHRLGLTFNPPAAGLLYGVGLDVRWAHWPTSVGVGGVCAVDAAGGAPYPTSGLIAARREGGGAHVDLRWRTEADVSRTAVRVYRGTATQDGTTTPPGFSTAIPVYAGQRELVATLAAGATEYSDGPVQPDLAYTYTVAAVTAGGVESRQATLTVVPPYLPQPAYPDSDPPPPPDPRMSLGRWAYLPATCPVTWEEAQRQLRLDDAWDRPYVESLIRAATEYVEKQISGFLMHRRVRAAFYDGEPLYLPRGPLCRVERVLGADGREAAGYELRHVGYRHEVVPHGPLAFPVLVDYCAGSKDRDAVPGPLRLAVRMLVASWYENREPTSDKPRTSIPHTVNDFLRLHRRTVGVA